MHDVAYDFACAEGCAETISANVLKKPFDLKYQPCKYICRLEYQTLLMGNGGVTLKVQTYNKLRCNYLEVLRIARRRLR